MEDQNVQQRSKINTVITSKRKRRLPEELRMECPNINSL